MKKKAAALIMSVLLMLSGCKSQSTDGEIKLPIYGTEDISFEIATAQYMDLTETASMGATIGYPYATYLYFPADALVLSSSVVKGSTVSKGDVLVQLDSSGLDYEINNQKTIVSAAYANASAGAQAQLQYQIEQYTLDMMLAEKDKYTITAPYDGIITLVNRVKEGDTAEGGTVCCGISEISKAEIYIDGSDASKFRFGQTAQVRIDSTTYDATVVAAPDVTPATASKTNRTMFVLADGVMDGIIEENAMAISAGWATIYQTTEKKHVLAVPDAAIKTSGTDSYVTLVDGDERFRLPVTIGVQIGGYTEILNGISEGDIVMAEGSGLFSDTSAKADAEENAWDNGGDWDNPDWQNA